MLEIVKQVEEATSYISKQWSGKPQVGMILGTGLSPMAREITTDAMIDYQDIPHFPHSTVESHAGRLVVRQTRRKIGHGDGRSIPFL